MSDERHMHNARDPFAIDGPTCISFSGGRTSAYMLWRVLQSNDGTLPDDAHVCFANTGKEEEATLRFVRDCAEQWSVPITWVEYRPDAPGFAVVDFDTASRNGEPFEAIIRKRNYLPNPVTRFCTVELKIRAMHKHLKSMGWANGDGWDQMVGIRADEQRRVSKIRDVPACRPSRRKLRAHCRSGQTGRMPARLEGAGRAANHLGPDCKFVRPSTRLSSRHPKPFRRRLPVLRR